MGNLKSTNSTLGHGRRRNSASTIDATCGGDGVATIGGRCTGIVPPFPPVELAVRLSLAALWVKIRLFVALPAAPAVEPAPEPALPLPPVTVCERVTAPGEGELSGRVLPPDTTVGRLTLSAIAAGETPDAAVSACRTG